MDRSGVRRFGAAVVAVAMVAGGVALAPPVRADVEVRRTALAAPVDGVKIDEPTGVVWGAQPNVFRPGGTGVDSHFVGVRDGAVVEDVVLPYIAGTFDIDSVRRRAYVLTTSSNRYEVAAVDLDAGTVVGIVALPSQPVHIDVDEVSGRFAVTVVESSHQAGSSNRVQVFDGPSLGRIADVPVGARPRWVEVADGGGEIFVTTGGTSTLVLSGADYSTQRSLPGRNGSLLAYDEAADVLYVASDTDGLLKLDATSGVVLDSARPWDNTSYGSPPGEMVLDRDGARLLWPNDDGQVSILDTATLDVVGVLGGFGQASGIDAHDDGTFIAVSGGPTIGGPGSIIELEPTVAPDPPPSVAALEAVIEEGDPVVDPYGGPRTDPYVERELRVVLDEPSTEWVRAAVAMTPGTAGLYTDYESREGFAYIAPGEQTGTLRFVSRASPPSTAFIVLADEALEESEALTFVVTSAVGATVDATPATITILDDDAPAPAAPVVSVVAGPSALEGDLALDVVAELDVPSTEVVTVDWSVESGTAVEGDDYTGTGGTFTFPVGETSATSSLVVVDDAVEEVDEDLTVSLASPVGATISPTAGSATGTIIDDDVQPVTMTASADRNVTEGGAGATTAAPVVVAFDRPAPSSAVLTWSATSLGSTAGVDHEAVGGEVVVAAGDTSASIPVAVLGDDLDEANERFAVDLVDVSGNAVLGADTRTVVTIVDDDARPNLAISDASAAEGDPATFTVSIPTPSARPISVRYATVRGTTASTDHAVPTGTVAIPAGQTSATITVATTEDALDEVDESFTVQLSGAVNAGLPDATAAGTIVDDDTATATVSSGSWNEGSTTVNRPFTVRLSTASSRAVTVSVSTQNGTAISSGTGADYRSTTATVSFAAGETGPKTVNVPIVGDRRREPNETFTVRVTATTGGAAGTGSFGTGTIRNDD